MSIARRIAELYNVKMNAALDRAADPRELVDYTYVQLQELLAEVRLGAAQVAASRKRAESRASELRRAGWASRRCGRPGGPGPAGAGPPGRDAGSGFPVG